MKKDLLEGLAYAGTEVEKFPVRTSVNWRPRDAGGEGQSSSKGFRSRESA